MINVHHRDQSILVAPERLKAFKLLSEQLEVMPEQNEIVLDASVDFDFDDLRLLLCKDSAEYTVSDFMCMSPRKRCDILLLADYLDCRPISLAIAASIAFDLRQCQTPKEIANYLATK